MGQKDTNHRGLSAPQLQMSEWRELARLLNKRINTNSECSPQLRMPPVESVCTKLQWTLSARRKMKTARRLELPDAYRSQILVVDDDVEFASLLALRLRQELGSNVTVVANAYAAMNQLLDSFYDLVVLDWKLAGANGALALKTVDEALALENRLPLRATVQRVPVILLSAERPELTTTHRNRKFFRIRQVLSKQQGLAVVIDSVRHLLAPAVDATAG